MFLLFSKHYWILSCIKSLLWNLGLNYLTKSLEICIERCSSSAPHTAFASLSSLMKHSLQISRRFNCEIKLCRSQLIEDDLTYIDELVILILAARNNELPALNRLDQASSHAAVHAKSQPPLILLAFAAITPSDVLKNPFFSL